MDYHLSQSPDQQSWRQFSPFLNVWFCLCRSQKQVQLAVVLTAMPLGAFQRIGVCAKSMITRALLDDRELAAAASNWC